MKEHEPDGELLAEVTDVLFRLESLVSQGILQRELVEAVLDKAEEGDYIETTNVQ